MRKFKVLLSCIFLLSMLVGCTGSRDLDELAIVVGIGIDKAEGKNNYKVTTQIAHVGKINTESGGSGGAGGSDSEGGGTFVNVSREGRGINMPLHDLSRFLSRKLYIEHNQIVVIGSRAAYEGVAPLFDYFTRNGRCNAYVLIAEGEAEKMFTEQTELESMPAAHIRKLMESRSWNSTVTTATIAEFLFDMVSKTAAPTAPFIELYETEYGKTKARISGTAVFCEDRICGSLSDEQTRAMLMLKNKINNCVFDVEVAGKYVSIEISGLKTKLKVEHKDGKFKILADIKLKCDVTEAPAGYDLEPDDLRRDMENAVLLKISSDLEETIRHTKSMKADVFGFGDLIYRRYPKESKEIIENWFDEFENLDVDISVNASISSNRTTLMPLLPRIGNNSGVLDNER